MTTDRPITPRGARRRDEILTAAIAACSMSGHGDASLREIAELANIKKGLLTYYFPTKEQLLFAIAYDMHCAFDRLLDEWATRESDDPTERLAGWFRAHALLACVLADQTRVTYESVRHLSPSHRATIRQLRRRYEAELGRAIDRCRPSGWVDEVPTESLVLGVLSILNWVYLWYRPGPITGEMIAESVARRALASLRPPPVETVGASVGDASAPRGG